MLVDPIPLGAQSRDVVLVCEDGVYNVDFTNYVGLQVHEGRGSNCLNPTMVSHSENPGFKGHERDPGHCACLSGPCDAGVCGQECFYNLATLSCNITCSVLICPCFIWDSYIANQVSLCMSTP